VNGVNAGTSTPSFSTNTLKNGDNVSCELKVNTQCGIVTVISNIITTRILDSSIPTINITTNTNTICAGDLLSFSASSTNEGLSPTYQWQINGNNTGPNSAVFSTNILTNGDVISCILKSSATCAVPSPVLSNVIAINVIPKVTPIISISASATSICPGSLVVFNAIATNGGNNPTYQWKINGNNTGTNSRVFNSSTLQHGDIVSCNLIADPQLNCITTQTVSSQQIPITVSSLPGPSIVIAASQQNVCPGTPVTFTASMQNTGDSPIFQWKINNVNTGENSPVYINNNPENGDRIECVLTAPNAGCSAAPVTSNTITILLKSKPIVSINPRDTIVPEGSQILLAAQVSGAISSFQWSPSGFLANPLSLNALTTPLSANTTFSLQVTNPEGCTGSAEAIVKIYKPLVMPTAFTPNNDGLNDVFRIPPNVLLSLGDFSIYDRWGNRIFSTNDAAKGWDGKVGGILSNPGVFVYVIKGNSGGKEISLKGTFLLIR
jgi:gliding motility-associated-like protein